MTRYSRSTLLLSWATPLTTVLLRLMQRLQVDTVVILRSESISFRSPSGDFPASSPGQTSYRSRLHLLRTDAGPSTVSNSATRHNAREPGIVGQEMCNRTVYHEDDLEAVKCRDNGMAGSMDGFHGRVAALYHSHSCQWRGFDVIVTWWDSGAPPFRVENIATTLSLVRCQQVAFREPGNTHREDGFQLRSVLLSLRTDTHVLTPAKPVADSSSGLVSSTDSKPRKRHAS
jgi:hypothetical protein